MPLVRGRSVPEILLNRVAATPDKTALMRKRDGLWRHVSFRDYETQVHAIARALSAAGCAAGDRVAILAQTRPEWAFIDVAAMSLGAVTVPLYPTLTADDVHAILENAGASFVFAENRAQAEKVLAARAEGKGPRLVTLEPSGIDDVPSLEDFVARARDSAPALEVWREGVRRLEPASLASIVYTSGTSGRPKGAELTHANFLAVMTDTAEWMGVNEDDVTLIFLPVAHVVGRIEQLITLSAGWVNAYAESLNALLDNLEEVRPTILMSVPRIYEKIFASFRKKAVSGKAVERAALREAFDVAPRWVAALESGRPPGVVLRGRHAIIDRLVFSELRKRLGGRLRFAISGGAPLPREIAELFFAAGVPLLEGYGLTETTGPIFVNTLRAWRLGTVGQAAPGTRVKMAEDGEILLAGPAVFRGYHRDPEATREALVEGYFATGDVGRMDGDAFLKITDRKKDILVTAGGKNVAPQKLENLLRADGLFSHALVVGDGRPYIGALLTLQADEARRVATRLGIPFAGLEALVGSAPFEREARRRIAVINAKLAPFESIKRFRLLSRDFSVEGGELTPSLKVRRKHCVQKYGSLIDDMYGAEGVTAAL